MPAPLVIPQSVNYSSPLIGRPARWRHEPREGDRVISAGISWGSANDGGPNNCVEVNCGQVQVNPLSQIAALYVNNLGSEADVSFLFISSQFKLTVPARSEGLFPVESSDTRFYVSAPGAAASDITYFQIYNALPPPVAIAKSDFTNAANSTLIAFATGTTNLIAAGTSGLLIGFSLTASNVVSGAGGMNDTISLTDGGSAVKYQVQFAMGANAYVGAYVIASMSGLAIPFTNGLSLVQAVGVAPTSGGLLANVFWR